MKVAVQTVWVRQIPTSGPGAILASSRSRGPSDRGYHWLETDELAEPKDDDSLSNGALVKFFGFLGFGVTSATGVFAAGEKFHGLTDQQIHNYLTEGHQVSLPNAYGQQAVEVIKSFKDSLVGHYIFVGLSGGVLTVFVLRAINPRMPWRRAIGYGVIVMVGLVALLVGAHYRGWLN